MLSLLSERSEAVYPLTSDSLAAALGLINASQ